MAVQADTDASSATSDRVLWRLPRAVQKLAALGVRADDSDDDRLRKATLTLAAALMATMAFVWVWTYWSLGLWRSGAIPFGYQIATVIGLVAFARTGNFATFRTSQLAMIFALPFLLQASLGGFRTSSAISLWSFVAPLGALLFEGARRAMPWFVAFAIATVLSGVLEQALNGEGDVPTAVVVTFFVFNLLGVSTTVFLLLRYFLNAREHALAALRVEQDRSERLLLNVLPATIARRLKDTPDVIADAFDDVTVLFADIVGFTTFADARPPGDVVAVLNELFSMFDELADRHNLEKIKTIGDAYMVAGGLPVPRADHDVAVAEMALDMCDAVARFRRDSGLDLAIRVGIASGPVVAGVIGHRKFSYDVWGDTVNVASRMESHGLPDRIHVTERVYERLRDRYELESRGTVDIKGKGPVPTYFLLRRG
ncbi:MAG TPA: adenylate/guanylate cyclase domain-containing protein [Acidimicrobiia bacterium]|nr:adenylate/guanylate cyclase domain-containing protein [Acidimicrobiia bacterium]